MAEKKTQSINKATATAAVEAVFEALHLPIKYLAGGTEGKYKVYTDKDNFVEIEANTVSEAIEKSDNPQPYKVVKAGIRDSDIVRYTDIIDASPEEES